MVESCWAALWQSHDFDLLDPYLVAGGSVLRRSPFTALAIVMKLAEAGILNPTSELCALNHHFVGNY